MSPAKVTLSPKERELVTDPSWILTKNRVIGKVYTLFGQLSEQYRIIWNDSALSVRTDPGFQSPKIARGEQYRDLPWVMLDNPRYFTTTDTFAIRSFFWWGNFCSITLQLSGHFKEMHVGGIQKYFREQPAAMNDWWIGTNKDAWQHHFEEDNYGQLSEKGLMELHSLAHLKLAKKISLEEWDNLPEFFTKTYREIIEMLTSQ
ncbi:MAG: hypothetical protein V4450_07690 [Bacteroidota bacterium]